MIKFNLVYDNTMAIVNYNLTSQIIIDDIDTISTELNIKRAGSLIQGEASSLFKLLYRLSGNYDIVLS